MTSQDKSQTGGHTAPDASSEPPRRRWLAYSLAGVAGLLGLGTVAAVAKGGPDGWCREGRHAGMHWGGEFDPSKAREFAERRVDRLLYELDATPEQRRQVKEIVTKAFEDMAGMRGQRSKDHKALIELLSQPEIDRAKLQSMRAERLRQMEQASEQMVQAFADAAEVLTPDQRARLGEVIAQGGFGRRRHRW